jgi:hypothetical protein
MCDCNYVNYAITQLRNYGDGAPGDWRGVGGESPLR